MGGLTTLWADSEVLTETELLLPSGSLTCDPAVLAWVIFGP